jgi:hypothetical protein
MLSSETPFAASAAGKQHKKRPASRPGVQQKRESNFYFFNASASPFSTAA